jgi:hypothetical protein
MTHTSAEKNNLKDWLNNLFFNLWQSSELKSYPYPLKEIIFEEKDQIIPFSAKYEGDDYDRYECYSYASKGEIIIFPVIYNTLISYIYHKNQEIYKVHYSLHCILHEFIHLFIPSKGYVLIIEEAISEYLALYFQHKITGILKLEEISWERICREFKCLSTKAVPIMNFVLALTQTTGIEPVKFFMELFIYPENEWPGKILDKIPYPGLRDRINECMNKLGSPSYLFGVTKEDSIRVYDNLIDLLKDKIKPPYRVLPYGLDFEI